MRKAHADSSMEWKNKGTNVCLLISTNYAELSARLLIKLEYCFPPIFSLAENVYALLPTEWLELL